MALRLTTIILNMDSDKYLAVAGRAPEKICTIPIRTKS